MVSNLPSNEKQDKKCCFCNEFGENQKQLKSRKRILFESNHSVAFISAGAIVEGHLLISPKSHWTSSAQISKDGFTDLINVKDIAASWLVDKFQGPIIEFEHGIIGEGSGGCGIDHAHIHIMPWKKDKKIADFLSKKIKKKLPFHDLVDMNSNCTDVPYLYLKDIDNSTHIFATRNLPSQFMRKTLSDIINLKEWDWRKNMFNFQFLKTLEVKNSNGIALNG